MLSSIIIFLIRISALSLILSYVLYILQFGALMEEESIVDKPPFIFRLCKTISQRYQSFLDHWTPYTLVRWMFTVFLGFLYMLRIIYVQGYYIVTYALGIYYLNLLIAFLSPKIDPAFAAEEDGPSLPTSSKEEFRPFMRRLPEFKFWYRSIYPSLNISQYRHAATKAVIFAFCCTFIEAFDIPVFWPILVVYFIILFCLTMKRQIKHMIKYRYVPFSFGKPRHTGKASQDLSQPLLDEATSPIASTEPLISVSCYYMSSQMMLI
ncbi:Protein RER1 [Trichinella sp. T8]|nr:Protein RER1 [Trichinella sp. T8]